MLPGKQTNCIYLYFLFPSIPNRIAKNDPDSGIIMYKGPTESHRDLLILVQPQAVVCRRVKLDKRYSFDFGLSCSF